MKYINEEKGMEYLADSGKGMECGACAGCMVCGVIVAIAWFIGGAATIFCACPDSD